MSRPLDGVTVADFSQMQQGGWATMKLGDMGADVIKIEPPHGDLVRNYAAHGELLEGTSTAYLAMNRNKRSVCLDLKTDDGKEIARDIVADADVLFENFRPGVMDRFGLSHEEVREFNPEIIYVSASGYGSTGPYSDRPGQDLLAQATSGIASITGRKDDPPTPAGTFVCDAHSATTMALHTVMALFQREQTGEGQRIEGDLLSAGVDLLTQEVTTAMNLDIDVERSEAGVGHVASGAPYGIYETEDGHIVISFSNLPELAEEFDLDPLCDYEDPVELYENRDTVFRQVQDAIGDEPTDELIETLSEAGLWVSRVNDPEEAGNDPQVRHNDMIVELEHNDIGSFEVTGVPVRMSNVDVEFDAPPTLGEHTDEVLAEFGYGEDERSELTERDVTQPSD